MKSRVIILVGLPAAGKSTLARELEKNDYCVVNEDVQGSKISCEIIMRAALRAGLNVVVDRCNLSKEERASWVRLAAQYDAKVECVVFIPKGDKDGYQRPALSEGFQHISYRYSHDPSSYDNSNGSD